MLGLDVQPRRVAWGTADADTAQAISCGGWERGDAAVLSPMDIRFALAMAHVVEPLAVFIEAPHVGVNKSVAVLHAMAIGSAWQAAEVRWPDAPITFVQPSEWKRRTGVAAAPRGIKSKRAIAMAAIEHGQLGASFSLSDDHQAQILKADKPFVYLRALELGFSPDGSQDAADAGLIAMAGALMNQEVVAIHQARGVA